MYGPLHASRAFAYDFDPRQARRRVGVVVVRYLNRKCFCWIYDLEGQCDGVRGEHASGHCEAAC